MFVEDVALYGTKGSILLFVYGTLKRGGPLNPWLMHGGGRYIATMELTGMAMYDLGAFPAIVNTEQESDVCLGEVWEVPVPLLNTLDVVESGAYRRLYMMVEIDEERGAEPMVLYALAFSPDGFPRVESGEWRVGRVPEA
jgi:gamma-glutamylcyclotransferase (GGCT)/AIG2-like uncharacterized protein YtfP